MRYKEAIMKDLESCEQLQQNLTQQIQKNQVTPQQALALLERLRIQLERMRDKLELE